MGLAATRDLFRRSPPLLGDDRPIHGVYHDRTLVRDRGLIAAGLVAAGRWCDLRVKDDGSGHQGRPDQDTNAIELRSFHVRLPGRAWTLPSACSPRRVRLAPP